jgi:hypothetical protein
LTKTGIQSGINFYKPTSSAPVAQDTYESVTPIQFDPELFHDVRPIRQHLDRLNKLAGQLQTAHDTVFDYEERLKAAIEELWGDNSTLRKRGLRGGTARKQRKYKGNYIKFGEHAVQGDQILKHRVAVETTDFLGRNRLLGLKALKDLFGESFKYLHEQQQICQELIGCSDLWSMAITQLKVFAQYSKNKDSLFQEEALEKIEDIEEMVEAFNEEYNKAL